MIPVYTPSKRYIIESEWINADGTTKTLAEHDAYVPPQPVFYINNKEPDSLSLTYVASIPLKAIDDFCSQDVDRQYFYHRFYLFNDIFIYREDENSSKWYYNLQPLAKDPLDNTRLIINIPLTDLEYTHTYTSDRIKWYEEKEREYIKSLDIMKNNSFDLEVPIMINRETRKSREDYYYYFFDLDGKQFVHVNKIGNIWFVNNLACIPDKNDILHVRWNNKKYNKYVFI